MRNHLTLEVSHLLDSCGRLALGYCSVVIIGATDAVTLASGNGGGGGSNSKEGRCARKRRLNWGIDEIVVVVVVNIASFIDDDGPAGWLAKRYSLMMLKLDLSLQSQLSPSSTTTTTIKTAKTSMDGVRSHYLP